MKKILPLLALSVVWSAPAAFGNAGIFGSDISLKLNNGAPTFFEASLLGDGRHAPVVNGNTVPTAPALDSAGGFTGGSRNLGTFNPGAGNTLTLLGGELLTFKNSGTDVTGAFINYQLDNNGFVSLSITFNEDNVNGANGDQRWATSNATVNLLAGLSNGTHQLSFYTSAPTNSVDSAPQIFDSNGGNNFTAVFTVVPEPGTWSMMVGGLGLLCFVRRLRRTSHA